MPVARRTVLGVDLAAATSALTGCGDRGGASAGGADPGGTVTATDAAGNRVGFGAAGKPTAPSSGTPSTSPTAGAGAPGNQARYAADVTALLRRHLPASTGFAPMTWLSASERAARMVATDARSSRGLLRGIVHDDVANHLAADTVRRMLTNHNAGKPAVDPDRPHRTAAHGLGVVLNQQWLMGRLASSRTFGHTGFAGPSLLVDPGRKLVLALLTNRAHPNWSWANPDPVRAAVGDLLAASVD
ncbi:serine hydrolase domain-containing protein [Micromonospora sp. WMMD736]|uniref:serine hydrolase domain-containing protein n=1 Tax=Micromonospora sp. WMMD736 TaxID=3404112 RepID=UPI003B958913